MEAYPEEFLAHNLPLVVLSGLDEGAEAVSNETKASAYPLIRETGPRIHDDSASITSPNSKELLQCFLDADTRGAPWSEQPGERVGTPSVGFRIKSVARDYVLPPRKAFAPPSSSTSTADSSSPSSSQSLVLHSPISPLSPGSPIFPDGVMTPIWIRKHQELVPSVFASFYTLTADPSSSSLHDNQLKTQINNIKKSFVASSYKTRFVVVLLSEKSILQGPEIDERIANIRRATSLDPKNSLFFLPPDSSSVELKAFVASFLATLQPVSVEYYRDLSKHARRKRNRSVIPPPTAPPTSGTSQTLSSQGWNVRYEFKLGVLAEFRQEMEAACRNFESAYDALLSQDVFESISSWSPRWNEARLLADVIAIRIMRCLLWNLQTTLAARKWREHRLRIQDLVDRRGLGTGGYCWAAWEARWAKLMAELIHKANIPALRARGISRPDDAAEMLIYSNPEKAIPLGERLHPWELLHHPGYWHALSSTHIRTRRILAEAIPEEDRAPPGQSPASKVASRPYAYDTYLCPDPHIESALEGRSGTDHPQIMVQELSATLGVFRNRHQWRSVERYRLSLGKEYMRVDRWPDALQNLWPLWQSMSWRREGWWSLVEDVGLAVRECATHANDAETLIQVEWELLSYLFNYNQDRKRDFAECLRALSEPQPMPRVSLKSDEVVSPVSATFAFKGRESHVGEHLNSQLVITSSAHHDSEPLKYSEIKIKYEGSLKDVVLRHSAAEAANDRLSSSTECPVTLEEMATPGAGMPSSAAHGTDSKPFLQGTADLTAYPGKSKAFTWSAVPREAGDAQMRTVTFFVRSNNFDFQYVYDFADPGLSRGLLHAVDGLNSTSRGRDNPPTINILPKPPKVQLRLVDSEKQYHTDEAIMAHLEVINREEVAVEASLEIRFTGQTENSPVIWWADHSASANESGSGVNTQQTSLKIGRLEPGARSTRTMIFIASPDPTDYNLEIKALYFLVSDPETPVSKALTVELRTIQPFATTYDFSPRLHRAPWPSFFDAQEDIAMEDEEGSSESPAHGIAQNWCLSATIESLASEALVIEGFELLLSDTNGGVRCSVSPRSTNVPLPLKVRPRESQIRQFHLEIQKLALDDRRGSSLDPTLLITWRRADVESTESTSHITSTRLAVPRLLIPSGEPRILAAVEHSTTHPPLIHLDYTIENPSMHLLTFNLSMDASEEFAFSGPKLGSLQLVPLSRHTVRFNVFPTRTPSPTVAKPDDHGEGEKGALAAPKSDRENWIQPQLKVVDRYYNQILRVSAASEGMKMDKTGILVWIGAS